MNKQFTLQDFVNVQIMVLDYFYKYTDIPDEGMSSEEVDERHDYFAKKAYQDGKLSTWEKDNFLQRHSSFGIGLPGSIAPKFKFGSNSDANHSKSLLEKNHG